MISVSVQGEPHNITVIQVYVPTTNAKEDEVEWFYEDLQDLLEITPKERKKEKKRCPFHHRGLEWVNLTQMTIISTPVGKSPLEEME